ncbi:MAG: dipeptidase [Verrucomicrobia bacterium]|nr:dipeptidase [Verrucomicrobiota bacterium]
MRRVVAQLADFLRWPSISTDPAHRRDVAGCARWLVAHLRSIGLAATLHPTPGHPVIVAHGPRKPGKPTVLIYGHYDVQPPDPVELWHSPPFEPAIRGCKLFARGAADNKGQVFAHITAVAQALREPDAALPNVIFLIEGEEEIGSLSIEPFLRAHRRELRPDFVLVSDTSMFAKNLPTITCSLRGVAAFELRVRGPARDLHSGIFGGTVANPATVLAQLIAALHDPRTGRVRVPGFYDGVRPLTAAQRRAWRRLPFSEDGYRRALGVPQLAGESGFTSLERRWARPTLEVNGIFGGYQGEGSKTVIPAWAGAKFTARLVPDQSPQRVVAATRRYLCAIAPPGVKLEFIPGHSAEPYIAPMDSRCMRAATNALRSVWGRPPVLVGEGGSIPIITSFKRILGADSVMVGFGLPDANAHSPDESLDLDVFARAIRASRLLLAELAR